MKLKIDQDYAALRRKAYPSLADQLDAYWKGGPAIKDMREKIKEVKAKYPKP